MFGNGSLIFISKVINQSQSITGNLGNTIHSHFNSTLNFATLARMLIKPINTSVLISQSSTNPCLNITNMPHEILTIAVLSHLAKLLDRTIKLIHTITHGVNAVFHSFQLPVADLNPFAPFEFVHKLSR